ncbi:unnamed protein product [Dracunculus medinensis]|uniref:Histidine ammonia-lyase n=1 Tax=Dracunculus medinensis TaxID=318479 RepID=A0A158Q5T4_DRAME|nr:unnamed protein product [Dracunculus medinensis]
MRLQVQIREECILVEYDENDDINTIALKAMEKFSKLKPQLLNDLEMKNGYREIRHNNTLLDPHDRVTSVLRDFDLIVIYLSYSFYEDDFRYIEPNIKSTEVLILDGNSLKTTDLVKCERGECILELSQEAKERIIKSQKLLEKIVEEKSIVYGISTGFGTFSTIGVPSDNLKLLQLNLIRSHASGYGKPLSPTLTRTMLALRINVLAKGHSGISLENLQKMIDAFNAFCVSYVPEQGTVGCSGDLCPLAHLALGLIGEGKMWSPKTGWNDASVVLAKNNLKILAVERANQIAKQADVIAALSLDVLRGTNKAFDEDIHNVRPHKGQIESAKRLRALLNSDMYPSQIAESHKNCFKVQDAYTLRCIPQVHGIVHDTIEFARSILNVEINSATDNPLIFPDKGKIISGGNFHGEYPAKVLDYLAIAIHEIAQMSERRLERLVNNHLSGLPTFLSPDGGLNCGFMVVQLCAASLVSENKVLCHPSSADSIPTSCNQEDHVSMGGFAARKALKVVEHVEAVLAIELIAACQGLEFLSPLTTTKPLEKVYKLVRSVIP